MPENIITNANDVELFIQSGNTQRGTSQSLGRLVVDEFSITKDEDDELISGIGFQVPAGFTNGNVTYGFSFTMQGEDVRTFEMVSDAQGRSNIFSFTAQRSDEEGVIRWQVALDTCKATMEEIGASDGDPMEYSVEGIAVSMDKRGLREDGQSAWE